MSERPGLTQRLVEVFLTGSLSPLLLLLSLVAGAIALIATPREEDPQIVVPVIDVVIDAPGTPALEVERQIATPLEQILRRIDGVEYVYSMSRRGQGVVTARFYVGENREDSLVKLHSALRQHQDAIPSQVKGYVVKPVAIDDVPIVAITLHSDRLDDHDLRRIAEEMQARLQQVPDTGVTEIHGGRPRRLVVEVDPTALAGRGLGFAAVERALGAASVSTAAGAGARDDRMLEVEVDPLIADPEALAGLVVGVVDAQPVHLRDVAAVRDGPAEVENYVRFGRGLGREGGAAAATPTPMQAAVTLSVAKRRGANAVGVAAAVLARLEDLRRDLLPADVEWTITRDSGRTADEKVDELIEGLAVAIAIVVILITMMLGWREAVVVAFAVPVTFGLTLLVNYLAGYSINRVTLFALILSLGLVVDDPIVDVENIHRHLQRRDRDPLRAVLEAVNEVRPPVIVATLAVIISFLPLFFITGMMGPYMRPMALNVPMAMLMSMVVAFTLTPWMAYLALRRVATQHAGPGHETSPALLRAYAALLRPLLRSRVVRWSTFAVTALSFVGVIWLGAARAVPLKMLPFDNKTELQVLVDLDEGNTVERTLAVVAELAEPVRAFAEVVDVTAYAGVASPMDFNGMVRKYYLRQAPHLGELRVRLLPKHERVHQSHQVALRLRAALEGIARARGATLRVVELPPGPPVLSTLVAEVRGGAASTPAELDDAARTVAARLAREPGVADVDTSAEATPDELHFVLDLEKAALHGVDARQVGAVFDAAVGGSTAAVLHEAREVNPLLAEVRVAPWRRADATALGAIGVATAAGDVVPLAEIGRFELRPTEPTIHRKNLERVAYVMAEAVGRTPAEIVLDVQADQVRAPAAATPASPRPLAERSMVHPGGGVPWAVPAGFAVDWRGEGEWKITLDAFRDLGLAFFAACLGIYVLLVQQTGSYVMPLVLMLSIPFTILGILPGFWLLNRLLDVPVAGVANPVFFTATAMIGMIALAGIAVRNSILLIDFIQGALTRGMALEEAILQSGAVRLRPIVLTAGAAILASIPITLDPIFSGLAWALIFGLVVSSAFTLVLVPVVYHGVVSRRR